MWTDIKASFGVGFRFAAAAPLIFLIPPILEFVQHVVEWRLGMYASVFRAEALANDPVRVGFGFIKLASLLFVGLWITRFIASSGDRAYTRAVDSALIVRFVPVILVSLIWEALQRASAPWTTAEALGQVGAGLLGVGIFFIGSVINVLLSAWRVAVPLQDRRISLWTSVRLGASVIWPGLGLYLTVFIPLLVLHTAMNVGMSLIATPVVLWALIVLDSLLVGYIATALWSVFHAVYGRAAGSLLRPAA